ncbi:unnamed protein product [Chondrus crispus]|uniref:Aminopeptidase N n=1 Tax=Chondrus crispus TaxID=2769 RepID=R7Q744_CHOCR|nr:unnamed protein product [Chondrus crispus]CDF33844.1 unnamed protein product [Chondrus crispus]|eukprot:XP_005713663.1 unnamed protein product [Chondrus crispus]
MNTVVRNAAFVAASLTRPLPIRSTHVLRRWRPASSFVPTRSFASRSIRSRIMPFEQAAAPVASAAGGANTATTAIAPPSNEPKEKFLKDYTPPKFLVSDTHLNFELDDDGLNTIIKGKLSVVPKCDVGTPFILDGSGLQLLDGSVKVDGRVLDPSEYVYNTAAKTLTIASVPSGPFTFESEVSVKPAKNTALDGLYMSTGDYCTQCEAEAFRKITFFPDRPDVMSKFTVRISADKVKYPVLLSNGNCISSGTETGDPSRHWVEYVDPFSKPCYLFALVAGDLSHLEDEFTTMGGRKVTLRVYVKGAGEVAKCHHAMRSLQKAMKWDEDTYGLEYNYDIFNIVAVPTFVFGAMENTSLNIFNSKYVLVSPETATDSDFNGVEGVVAHEYFHNYSGNRVTVSSWFQLSLKEGLTVFRDQSFSADMNSATVKRIQDVTSLRIAQFAEDAGPMAHPIRPESYITCNSFYTATVYNKGAEVIRMLKTLVGPEGFRKGTDIYFSRNDGKAVTCEDWVQAIQDANPEIDLGVFRRWYSQAGTPIITVDAKYDETTSRMTLSCDQAIPPTKKQPTTQAALIPMKMGLIGPDGNAVPVDMGDGKAPEESKVLILQEAHTDFVLHNVPKGTVPSLLREFSAPVKIERKGGVSADELAFIMGNDTDEFSRWDAGQTLSLKFILDCVKSEGDFSDVPQTMIDAFRKTLLNKNIDAALRAQVFRIPPESYITEQMELADPVRIRAAREHVINQVASGLELDFRKILDEGLAETGEYKLDPASQGTRALKNIALMYLGALEKKDIHELCLKIVRDGSNMTDVLAALGVLSNAKCEERTVALSEFYEKWQSYGLVVDKWLSIQATSTREDVLGIVKGLTAHKCYSETVPNSVYALIGGYGRMNLHIPSDGSGYKFLTDQVIHLNSINPQVAARMARCFTRWRKYDKTRQNQMEAELRRVKATEGLSEDVFEVVNNCLDQAE